VRVGESEAYMLEPYLLEGVLDESEAYLLVPYLAEPDVPSLSKNAVNRGFLRFSNSMKCCQVLATKKL